MGSYRSALESSSSLEAFIRVAMYTAASQGLCHWTCDAVSVNRYFAFELLEGCISSVSGLIASAGLLCQKLNDGRLTAVKAAFLHVAFFSLDIQPMEIAEISDKNFSAVGSLNCGKINDATAVIGWCVRFEDEVAT